MYFNYIYRLSQNYQNKRLRVLIHTHWDKYFLYARLLIQSFSQKKKKKQYLTPSLKWIFVHNYTVNEDIVIIYFQKICFTLREMWQYYGKCWKWLSFVSKPYWIYLSYYALYPIENRKNCIWFWIRLFCSLRKIQLHFIGLSGIT